MRAIWTTGTNGPDSLEVRETEDPEPGPGQVRIRVRAAGLCFAEVMAAQGLYPDAPKPSAVLGYEAAGVIDKVGDGVDQRRMGSHVVAMARFGAHSDVVCVPGSQAFTIPRHKDFIEAAAIPVNYLTAYHILFRVATVRPASACSSTWPRAASARRRSSCAARSTAWRRSAPRPPPSTPCCARRAARTPSTTTPRTTPGKSGC